MGCSCCTTGATERETLLSTLRWESGWAVGLAKDMQIVLSALARIAGNGVFGSLHTSHEGMSADELGIELDAIRTMAGGLLNRINSAYKNSDRGTSILPDLTKQIKEVEEECNGKRPIPIDAWFKEKPKILQKMEYREYVFIPGNSDFFFRLGHCEALNYIKSVIEKKACCAKYNPSSLIFNSEFVLEILSERPNGNGKSVLEVLRTEYPNIHFLCSQEDIVEYTGKIEFIPTPEEKIKVKKNSRKA